MTGTQTKKILITGVGGYVGSYAAQFFLEKGYEVRGLDVFIFGKKPVEGLLQNKNFKLIEGDIRDENKTAEALDNVDAVIHLAAIVGAPESNRIPDLTWAINLDATKSLVNLVKKAKTPRFVFVSTCSNYGASGAKFVDETSPLDPISAYAESKVEAEKFIAQQQESDFNPIVCRLATVFGVSPRMRFDLIVNEFARDALLKKKLVVFGAQGRTFVHVHDVARSFLALLEAPLEKVRGQTFNIGSTAQSNLTKFEVAKTVADQLEGVELELVDKDLDGRDYKVNFDKINNELGFEVTKTLAQGVKEIVDYLRENTDIDPYSNGFSNLQGYLNFK